MSKVEVGMKAPFIAVVAGSLFAGALFCLTLLRDMEHRTGATPTLKARPAAAAAAAGRGAADKAHSSDMSPVMMWWQRALFWIGVLGTLVLATSLYEYANSTPGGRRRRNADWDQDGEIDEEEFYRFFQNFHEQQNYHRYHEHAQEREGKFDSAKDYYATLGLKPDATENEIKKAYRKRALLWHPDKNAGNPHAEAQFKTLVEAYEVLMDSRQRRMYDLSRPR